MKCKAFILKDKKTYHVLYANETKSKQFKSNNGAYSCSLNSCGVGSSKVYSGSFDTLNNCNAKCVTPSNIQPTTVPQTQTCQQIASGLGASYKNTPVISAKECMDFAVLDCQDTGKILDGYGISGDCCYFTCVVPAIPEPVVCSNTDSGLSYPFNLQTIGACTDSNGYIEDTCDNGMLKEYYCEPGLNGGPNMCGYTSYNCDGVIPGTTCQNGRCV